MLFAKSLPIGSFNSRRLISGVLTCVCVSWYAAEVVREYYSPYYQTQKLRYTLGACLYVGWVASVFSLIAGGLMACCSCFAKPVDQTGQYKPAKQQFSYPTSAPGQLIKISKIICV